VLRNVVNEVRRRPESALTVLGVLLFSAR